MGKLALNFICKNESHVIERMLSTAKDITDLIVVNDTGSTDGTQDMIRKFGQDNNIPTYVFERLFDNFEASRNFAMDKLRDVVSELDWDPNDIHGYWFDCDEELIVDPKFDKKKLTKDFYMINTYINNMKYTRNTFFRLSKPFRWYGVCHEFIVCDDKNITSGLADDIHVKVHMDGASWKGQTSEKYLSHAHILEKYIAENKKDPRWIFYTAQSYHDSANMVNDKSENDERLRRALKYYKERAERPDGFPEERFYAQFRVGVAMKMLEYPWKDTHQELLKAYTMDIMRAEPIKAIIDYYMSVQEWQLAYMYSKFAKINFHGKNPYPKRLLFIDETLYGWKILESHSASCFYTGRKDEARANYNEMLDVIRRSPNLFTPEDIQKINSNAQFFK